MALSPGFRLGPYEIASAIGAGGMGEVYRARDTKLDREVAIKILPDAFATDEERVARFEREAKLLASLNHPNIAGIFGFESGALVLELVDGPTLAERIEKGPIPVDESIAIARQIADALEAGHEAGIVHRDLKPSNIKVKEDGTVKVLDYGLAKAFEGAAPPSAESELSQSPTLTRQGTQVGVILGTAAYMSPEQAKGKRVDRRADIWAFGAVLYEMLTGKRAFAGEDVSDTLAAVLRAEPDFGVLPHDTPDAVRMVLRVCLTKDVRSRCQAIGDVRLVLEGVFETTSTSPSSVRRRPWLLAASIAFAALAGLMAGLGLRSGSSPEEIRTPVRLTLPAELSSRWHRAVAISRDGRRIAYVSDDRIWLRDLEALDAEPVAGTEGALDPFFSPDGEWIGFFAGGKLKKVAVNGSSPVTLCPVSNIAGAFWADGGDIVFAVDAFLLRVSADGGEPEQLTTEGDGAGPGDPHLLPGGKHILYTGFPGGRTDVRVRMLPDGEPRILVTNARAPRYLATGHLVYFQSGVLFAVPFDARALTLEGGPVPVVEDVGAPAWSAHYDVSDTGILVYLRAKNSGMRRLVWVDRDGREETLPVEAGEFSVVDVSPSGTRAVFDNESDNRDIWLYELSTSALSRFTFDPSEDVDPLWSLDERRIFFASARDGSLDLYWKSSDGTGSATRVTDSEVMQWPQALSPDGDVLLIDEIVEGAIRLAQIDLQGSSEPMPMAGSVPSERLAQFSPDGRYVVYESWELGVPQIFVRTFPDGAGKWQVSNDGGRAPRWSSDGHELFYLDDGALMAVRVETDPVFRTVGTQTLFEGPYRDTSHSFDVTPDGNRFLMIRESEPSSDSGLVVVLDWIEELKRIAPHDR